MHAATATATAIVVTRFWLLVNRGELDECWPWFGYTEDGYGRFYYDGRMRPAHELALTWPRSSTCRRR